LHNTFWLLDAKLTPPQPTPPLTAPQVSAIDKLLSAFIVPLQSDNISTPDDHRVHCSLNLNTETGRLSARRPNLQNQPALEKDRYKVGPQLEPPCLEPISMSFCLPIVAACCRQHHILMDP
jgi:hypothetical protein